jgi:hypothetical protein
MKLVLDVELYAKGVISTHKPLEVDTNYSDSVQSATIMIDSPRQLYFDKNGFQCDRDGSIRENPVYLLIEGAIA